jgi:hypothetical protein
MIGTKEIFSLVIVLKTFLLIFIIQVSIIIVLTFIVSFILLLL